jgi:transposase-like protein
LLRCIQTIQVIASKHNLLPSQVSTWKRQAMGGLGAVFLSCVDRARGNDESEVRDLHAKIGKLTVEGDFLARGLKR